MLWNEKCQGTINIENNGSLVSPDSNSILTSLTPFSSSSCHEHLSRCRNREPCNVNMQRLLVLVKNYNMTVWVLAGNGIEFSIAAAYSGYICPASSNRMCNEGGWVTPCPSCQSLPTFRCDSVAHWYQNEQHNFPKFIVNIFHCCTLASSAYKYLDHSDLK